MLPKAVKIGGQVYDVHPTDVDINCAGEIMYAPCTIRIATDRHSVCAQEQALWHEIVHGIGYDRGIKQLCGETADENLVDQLGFALHAFMVDNGLAFPNTGSLPPSSGSNTATAGADEPAGARRDPR